MVGVDFKNASQIPDGAAAALARMTKRNDSKDDTIRTNGLERGEDTIDIRSGGTISAPAGGGQDTSASTGSYSTIRMINFSVTYPDGSTMTTSMSESDFQAALESDDPLAFGGMQIGQRTWYGKDAILPLMTGRNASGDPLQAAKAGSSQQSDTFGVAGITSRDVTGEDVAMAVLTSTLTDEVDPGGSAQADEGRGGNQSSKVVGERLASASLSLSGSGNGMSATISFVSVSATAASVASTSQAAADNHVSILT